MLEFEAAYYINLEYRIDRRKKFEQASKYLDIKNIIRVNAIESNAVDLNNWPGSANELAIRLSHIITLEDAHEKGFNHFIVFEDDAVISSSFQKKLSNVMSKVPKDWDMIYLYAENHFLEPVKINDSIIKLRNTLGLVAIAYNGNALGKIIKKLKSDLRWVDSVMADLHNDLNVYAPIKSIVQHPIGYSDNLQMVTDYKNRAAFKLYVKFLNFIRTIKFKN